MLNGATFASSGFALTRARNLLQAIHHLRIHRMLDPQRAVLIKRGNALLGRHELRAALSRSRLDEFHDGLFGRAVVPRSQRVRGLRDGCRESHHANKRGGEQAWFVYDFHGFDLSAFFHCLL